MREEEVVSYFKDYLINEGWTVESIIASGYIEGTDYSFIPDVLAHKGNDILVAEAKGLEGLREIQTSIGQAVTYLYYGANIIVIVVPKEIGLLTKAILENVNLKNKGRIGLFTVNKKGSDKVKELISYIRIKGVDIEKGIEKIRNITFIRDFTVEELKRLLEKLYTIKKKYYSGRELYNILSKRDKDYVFRGRSTRGGLTERSFTNTLITTNNLGLTENGRLTPLGISYALMLINSEKRFDLELLKLLLIKGNMLKLLREIEYYIKNEKLNFNEAIVEAVKSLKDKNYLKETIININDYINRTKANQIKWLRDLGAINDDNSINWTIICDALSD